MTKYIFFLLLTLQGFLVQAQTLSKSVQTDNKQTANIDKVVHISVQKFLSDSSRVGLSIGIYLNGKEFFFNYGSTEKENQILPTSRTIYEIGSISKTFTGTLLAQAVKI